MSAPVHPLLRLAVVAGGATLLLGLVGMVMLLLRDDAPTADGPERHVHVTGAVAGGEAPTVEVLWHDGEDETRTAARRGEAEGVWVLPPLPEGRAVTLRVRRGDTGAVVYQVEYTDALPEVVEIAVGAAATSD